MIYRDRFHDCLNCGAPLRDAYAAGHRFDQCPECRAQWVEEGQLACMYNDLAGPFTKPEFSDGAAPPSGARDQRCPDCEQPMQPMGLFDVSVLRCPDHGIWFDSGELEKVLEQVVLAATPGR